MWQELRMQSRQADIAEIFGMHFSHEASRLALTVNIGASALKEANDDEEEVITSGG